MPFKYFTYYGGKRQCSWPAVATAISQITINYLVMTYTNEIGACANQLDPEAVSFLLAYCHCWDPKFSC